MYIEELTWASWGSWSNWWLVLSKGLGHWLWQKEGRAVALLNFRITTKGQSTIQQSMSRCFHATSMSLGNEYIKVTQTAKLSLLRSCHHCRQRFTTSKTIHFLQSDISMKRLRSSLNLLSFYDNIILVIISDIILSFTIKHNSHHHAAQETSNFIQTELRQRPQEANFVKRCRPRWGGTSRTSFLNLTKWRSDWWGIRCHTSFLDSTTDLYITYIVTYCFTCTTNIQLTYTSDSCFASPPTIALSEDGGTPSKPKQKNASRKQAKPRSLAASNKKNAPVILVQSDNDEGVEIVSGPPQYNRGKTVLGGSNAGKRDDLTHRPLFWGGDGPDFVSLWYTFMFQTYSIVSDIATGR